MTHLWKGTEYYFFFFLRMTDTKSRKRLQRNSCSLVLMMFIPFLLPPLPGLYQGPEPFEIAQKYLLQKPGHINHN